MGISEPQIKLIIWSTEIPTFPFPSIYYEINGRTIFPLTVIELNLLILYLKMC